MNVEMVDEDVDLRAFKGPVTAYCAGYLYVHCPACNRPPHESYNPRCRRCKGFGYLIVKDRRFDLKTP